VTGVSTYNVVPDRAGYYFNKVQCFCFEQQRLRGGEVVDMPVFFYIDPELVDDFNCRYARWFCCVLLLLVVGVVECDGGRRRRGVAGGAVCCVVCVCA
jgi:hypothetical protein